MEGRSLDCDDAVDDNEKTFLTVVSGDQEEGDMFVSIPYLIPRAGNIITMQGEGQGWQFLQVPYGRIASARTEIDKLFH